MKVPFPKEGGIITLWSAGLAMGLSFLIERKALVPGSLFLAGSLLLFASATSVERIARSLRRRDDVSLRVLVPPALGFLCWGSLLSINTVLIFTFLVVSLAFVSVRVIQRREREWQTRVCFTAAVLFMALLGAFASGAAFGTPLVALVFALPFTFFSAQELFVQHVAEKVRLSRMNGGAGFRDAMRGRRFVLYAFLSAFAFLSAASFYVTHYIAFPVAFGLLLAGFPTMWVASRRKVSFQKLGVGQAALDVGMVLAVVAFANLAA